MTKKVTSIDVRGVVIDIFLLSATDYNKVEDYKDSMAATIWNEHKLVFNMNHLDILTIRHELCHAFIKAAFTERIPDLTTEQLEEVAVETFSYFGPQIIDISNSIYKKLLDTKEKYGKIKNRTRKR